MWLQTVTVAVFVSNIKLEGSTIDNLNNKRYMTEESVADGSIYFQGVDITILVTKELLIDDKCRSRIVNTISLIISDLLNMLDQGQLATVSIVTIEERPVKRVMHLIIPRSDAAVARLILKDGLQQICNRNNNTSYSIAEALHYLRVSQFFVHDQTETMKQLLILAINHSPINTQMNQLLTEAVNLTLSMVTQTNETIKTPVKAHELLLKVIVTLLSPNLLGNKTVSCHPSLQYLKNNLSWWPIGHELHTNNVTPSINETTSKSWIKTHMSEKDRYVLMAMILLFGIVSLINLNLTLIIMHMRDRGKMRFIEGWCQCISGKKHKRNDVNSPIQRRRSLDAVRKRSGWTPYWETERSSDSASAAQSDDKPSSPSSPGAFDDILQMQKVIIQQETKKRAEAKERAKAKRRKKRKAHSITPSRDTPSTPASITPPHTSWLINDSELLST